MEKSTEETKKVKKLSKKVSITIALCTIAVILVGSFFAYASTYTRVLPNIYVEDIKIGGMPIDAAEEKISNSFRDIAKGKSISIVCEGNEKAIALDELEFNVDITKTKDTAYGIGREKGNWRKILKIFTLAFRPERISVAASFNTAELNKIIDELSNGKEIAPTDTGYILDGNKLIISKGHDGKMVDRTAAAEKFTRAAIDPSVKKVKLDIETIAAKTPDLDEFYQELTAPKKDAQYILEDGKIRIEPEKVGITVEKSKIREALLANQEQYELIVETSMPEVTAEKLQQLLFRDTLGSFSSSFATSTYARASNVTLTANRINGKILMPGDVFSYDKTIGRRTSANGYKEAGIYIGNKVESGIGGGICQTSSTLYSAALYANLEIVARTSHSLPVSYVPLGQDATIAEGYIDFKFKNNTDYPVKIVATVNGRRLTCSLLGVKAPNTSVELVNTIVSTSEPSLERTENEEIPQGYKRILNKGAKGFTVASQRIVKESGKVIKTEKLTKSVYRAAPVEEEVNPLDKNTPTEDLKIYVPGMEIPEEPPKTEPNPDTKPEQTEAPPVEESHTEETNTTEAEDEIVNV